MCAVESLGAHARAVAAENERLHLTSIRDPEEFLERHVAESLLGATLLAPARAGILLDLGSGNGYPGLAVAAARPALVPWLAEVSEKKAAFLERTLRAVCGGRGRVLARQIQRPADLPGADGVAGAGSGPPPLEAIATRAMGGWQKIVPRVAAALAPGGTLLVWAGEELESVRFRAAWSRLEAVRREPIPGRARSWIWEFRPLGPRSGV